MKLPRRKFLHLAVGTAALPAVSRFAWAQSYPARPVHVIVGFPAGSGPDIVARLMGQSLSERLGQPFVIENRTGAGGNIGTEAVVRATPDGYTLLFVTAGNAWTTSLYDKLNFDFIRDIAPVATIDATPFVMEVNPSFSAKTIAEFITYAKANPGKINMATAGIGSGPHIYGALFNMMAGVDLVPVHYRGNPLPDLLGGQVQVYFGPIPASIGYIRTDKLRALAVTSAMRSEALPDIPTVGDFVPGYEASGWVGIGAHKNTPAEIVDKLNKDISAILADPMMKARLADLGAVPMPMTPAEFEKLIADETDKWAKVIRAANIKAE
jgi:tripartite-type tricarboxylate transporter receptor subunit TctC